jgi:hypothetical protein
VIETGDGDAAGHSGRVANKEALCVIEFLADGWPPKNIRKRRVQFGCVEQGEASGLTICYMGTNVSAKK